MKRTLPQTSFEKYLKGHAKYDDGHPYRMVICDVCWLYIPRDSLKGTFQLERTRLFICQTCSIHIHNNCEDECCKWCESPEYKGWVKGDDNVWIPGEEYKKRRKEQLIILRDQMNEEIE